MKAPVFIACSKAIAARALGGEMIVMSAVDSTLFTLNEVATAIWEAADGVTPLMTIVERKICTKYDVSLEQAYADAEELVNNLVQHGILIADSQPITSAPAQVATI